MTKTNSASNYWKIATALCKERGLCQYKLSFNGTVLTLPDYLADNHIRAWINAGKSLEEAYKRARVGSLIPPMALRPCIKQVFKTKFFDPKTKKWISQGSHATCIGFHHCLAEYIPSLVHDDPQTLPENRRMQIAPGILAPSPKESECIKSQFILTGSLPQAYYNCGADSIRPKWSGAMEFIKKALTNAPGADLYSITKNAYIVSKIIPGVPAHDPHVPHIPPDDEYEKKIDWTMIALAGGIALVILSSKSSKN